MHFPNYVSAIASEAQQLGKAYVASLISPSEGKDHETHRGREVRQKEKAKHEVAEDTAAPMFLQRGSGEKQGVLNEMGSNDKSNTTGCSGTGSSGNSQLLHPKCPLVANGEAAFVSYSQPLPCADAADTTTTVAGNTTTTNVSEAVVLTTGLRKSLVKKAKVPRSKFGAVKIELEGAEQSPPISVSSIDVHTLHESKSINDNKSSSTCGNNECLREPQEAALLTDVSINNSRLKSWCKWRDILLHLLYADLDKRARSPIAGWAQNVIRYFAERIMLTALNSVIDDETLKKQAASTSVDDTLEDIWRNSEVVFRSCVTRAIPREVFAPSDTSENNIGTTGDSTVSFSLESPSVASFEGTSWIHEALLNALLRAQRWCGEGRLKMLLGSLSEYIVEAGMREFLDLCYAPLLFLVAEHCRQWMQSHPPPGQIEKENDRELEAWAKQMIGVFCASLLETDLQSRQLTSGVSADKSDPVKMSKCFNACVDAGEFAVENGTFALWLVRETTVLSLLLVRVLRVCVMCEVEE